MASNDGRHRTPAEARRLHGEILRLGAGQLAATIRCGPARWCADFRNERSITETITDQFLDPLSSSPPGDPRSAGPGEKRGRARNVEGTVIDRSSLRC